MNDDDGLEDDDFDRKQTKQARLREARQVALADLLLADVLGLAPSAQPQEESGMPSLAWLKESFKTSSAQIRYLHDQGHSVNKIHKHTGLRYQHVRNVLKNQLKRGPHEQFNLGGGQASTVKSDESDQ